MRSPTEEEIEEWVQLYAEEDWELTEIGEKYGFNRNTISKHIRRKTGAERTTDLKRNPDKWEKLHTEEEMPVFQIGQLPKVYSSRDRIAEELKERGVYKSYKHKCQVDQEEKAKWKRLHTEEDMTPRQIEKQVDFDYKTIRRYLIEMEAYEPASPANEWSRQEKFEFWAEVDEKSGCWIWQGNQHGSNLYARFEHNGERHIAHRASLEIYKGLDLTTEDHVRHKCDRKMCVNPNHLEIGTQAENVQDIHQTKKDIHNLSHNQLQEMLSRQEEDWLDLAEEFDVRLATIRYILEEK